MTQNTDGGNGSMPMQAPRPRLPMPGLMPNEAETQPSALELRRPNQLDELEALIGQESPIPKLGAEASARMRESFADVAADIRRIAKTRVEEALALQQEAESYASTILNAGDVLCRTIERDATRVDMASKVIRKAQEIIGQTPLPE